MGHETNISTSWVQECGVCELVKIKVPCTDPRGITFVLCMYGVCCVLCKAMARWPGPWTRGGSAYTNTNEILFLVVLLLPIVVVVTVAVLVVAVVVVVVVVVTLAVVVGVVAFGLFVFVVCVCFCLFY